MPKQNKKFQFGYHPPKNFRPGTVLYPGQMLWFKMMGKVITGSWFVGFDLYVLTYLDDQLPVSNR